MFMKKSCYLLLDKDVVAEKDAFWTNCYDDYVL